MFWRHPHSVSTKFAPAAGAVISDYTHFWPMDDSHVIGAIPSTIQDLGSAAHLDAQEVGSGITSGSTTGIPSPQYATCRAFAAGGNYASLTGSPNNWNGGAFSFAGWVKFTNIATAFQTVFVDDRVTNGTNMLDVFNRGASGDILTFNFSGTRYMTPTGTLVNGTWVNFVFTSSGLIFINGSPVTVSTTVTADTAGQSTPIFGAVDTVPNNVFVGSMYKIAIYTRNLTAADAALYYSSG